MNTAVYLHAMNPCFEDYYRHKLTCLIKLPQIGPDNDDIFHGKNPVVVAAFCRYSGDKHCPPL